jgi:hypothetical protein
MASWCDLMRQHVVLSSMSAHNSPTYISRNHIYCVTHFSVSHMILKICFSKNVPRTQPAHALTLKLCETSRAYRRIEAFLRRRNADGAVRCCSHCCSRVANSLLCRVGCWSRNAGVVCRHSRRIEQILCIAVQFGSGAEVSCCKCLNIEPNLIFIFSCRSAR